MKLTYFGTWSANMSDIRCYFVVGSDSTSTRGQLEAYFQF